MVRVLLLKARRLSHLQTRAQRHAWVRARLAYPVPRVHIGINAPQQQRAFVRISGLPHGTHLEVGPRVRAWVASTR